MSSLPDGYDSTPEILRQSYVLVKIAAARAKAGRSNLTYFVRLASSHGLEVEKIAEAANLSRSKVVEMLEPFEGSFVEACSSCEDTVAADTYCPDCGLYAQEAVA